MKSEDLWWDWFYGGDSAIHASIDGPGDLYGSKLETLLLHSGGLLLHQSYLLLV